ncbi:bifunctional nitrate reductase/sulfite reductase flavoprotein subunit alpha [Pararhizobium antarcticum]|uniref:assimilatory sulfite reductase (NADPH) n=1 Tax=Pararhizobium antarcticum TaxID=1798805 RepID=A0A657LZU1_9HYPH|nr:bifunctional nitrate reductase/sulfite reductase flavoprotein subunit alpha [Pararhizobium antarcticum]OJF96549.1 reductase [Rhizobium sp. 58]OJG01446.1 reductase [Pararhizobium antarcticum]
MNIHTSSTRKVKSACPYCGVGCGIVMEVAGNRVTKVTGDKDHPANRGRLCTKGMTSAQAIEATGRLDRAFIRADRNGEQVPVALDRALSETAERLKVILERDGPDAIALYVSGQMSIEAQYLANKLAKGFIRTQHIESNSRLCMASAASGYKLSLGADGPPGSYDDIDKADLFLVIGSNMADCHPVLFLRLMDRVRQGAKLIVVDPRRTATAEKAGLFLQIKGGTDLALLNGLLHLLHDSGRIDTDFISAHTDGWADMLDFLSAYAPDAVAAITGLAAEDIRNAAEMIGNAGNWISLWTMGLNQSTHGTWSSNALCNLHLATGAICRPGSGPFSLTGQPNAMGGREMGYMGPGLPGQRSALVDADRQFVEKRWALPKGTIRSDGGGGTISLFEDMRSGLIKACWIICTNPVASVANRATVIDGLKKAELVITQDVFLDTETNIYADILLPGALWAEAEGVMVNSERTMTLMGKAVEPPGEARPDWWIIAEIACRMGYAWAFTYASAAEVFDEIRGFANAKTGYDISGATHGRLAESPLQWPVAKGGTDRNPVRYRDPAKGFQFPTASGKAQFFARPHLDASEMPDEQFPFVLNTGRLQHQWHTMTKTGKIQTLNKLNSGPFVEIHPQDAQAFGVSDGDRVEIRSRRGFAILPAIVTDRVLPGACFAPFHWNDIFGNDIAINAVTCDAVDPISLQPELKVCAVALSPVGQPSKATPSTSTLVQKVLQPVTTGGWLAAGADRFASAVGLKAPEPLVLAGAERAYLEGFILGLRIDDRAPSGVPVLPPNAPLPLEKRQRLNGLLAGLFSRDGPSLDAVQTASASLEEKRNDGILMLWSSQTGTAEELAKRCAADLGEHGLKIRLACMEECAADALLRENLLLVVTSTFGDGEAPDNGAGFWRHLQNSKVQLPDLGFAILALGDSSYGEFCGFGRRLDEKLEALGARRLLSRIDCDGDGEDKVDGWLDAVIEALTDDDPDPLDTMTVAKPAPLPAITSGTLREKASTVRLIRNLRLNGAGSAKETRQIGFDLRDTGLNYEAGDALGIRPSNCPALVAEILDTTGLSPEALVIVPDAGEMPLADALADHFEIARITPDFLRFVAERSRNEGLNALLHRDNKAGRENWLWGRQVADVLSEYRPRVDAGDFLSSLKRLQPRLYSISSSPKAHAGEVHLTVSTVRYAHQGRARHGVCSVFLADRAEQSGASIFVRPAPGFRLPGDAERPVIMIGPGTGIAPFRGFLADRAASGATGRNWLFFGEQHASSDFYYRDELLDWQHSGVLTRLDTAFSRDGTDKVYVQDRMLEKAADLWRWIEEGASVYVCGDASRMARDVDAALKAIVAGQGQMSDDKAADYVARLARDKRYLRDVY